MANEKAVCDADVAFYETLIAKRLGITRESYRAMIVQELYLHAEEAVKAGFADKVLTTSQLGE